MNLFVFEQIWCKMSENWFVSKIILALFSGTPFGPINLKSVLPSIHIIKTRKVSDLYKPIRRPPKATLKGQSCVRCLWLDPLILMNPSAFPPEKRFACFSTTFCPQSHLSPYLTFWSPFREVVCVSSGIGVKWKWIYQSNIGRIETRRVRPRW